MKNKEKAVNHFLSAWAPPEFCNNERGGDTIITAEYCITDGLHKWNLYTESAPLATFRHENV